MLVRTRPPKGLLGGMTEIPGSTWAPGDPPGADSAPISADWRRLGPIVEHVFTHFALRLVVYRADLPAGTAPPEGYRFVREGDLPGEALPTIMRKVVAVAQG